jgi:hypothetical protein
MICQHPQCTGKHRSCYPVSVKCPAAIARFRKYYSLWRKTDIGKQSCHNSQKKYAHSAKGRAVRKRVKYKYNSGPKALLSSIRYKAKIRLKLYEAN